MVSPWRSRPRSSSGISGKPEIEQIGIAEFNRACRENVFTYKEDWERLSRRIGYWLDYDRPYITFSPEYVESVWWALSEIERKGLLYRGLQGPSVLPSVWDRFVESRGGPGVCGSFRSFGHRPIPDRRRR